MTNAVSINAPTFFSTNTNLFQDTIAAIQFGFTGLSVAPCAIPIVPTGVGIFPQVRCPALLGRYPLSCMCSRKPCVHEVVWRHAHALRAMGQDPAIAEMCCDRKCRHACVCTVRAIYACVLQRRALHLHGELWRGLPLPAWERQGRGKFCGWSRSHQQPCVCCAGY